jgi:DNA polymerase-3 subunit beta
MIVLKAANEKLLGALQSVAGIVERRHTLPILANVLLRKNGSSVEFTSSDLEIQVRTNADLGGEEATFSTLVSESADFGAVFAVPQKTLKGLLDQVHFAMAVHDIRYYLNGILFIAEGRTLTLVATDGHRLALAQASLEGDVPSRQEVILPRKTVLELQRLLRDEAEPIEMKFANNQAKFSFSGMEFVTKLVEGKFPDYNRVIPKAHRNTITLGREPLLASLQRAAILTSEKFKGVRLNFEPGLLRIGATNAEQEEAAEEIEIDYAGDAIDIGFNVTYLMDALGNMDVDMVRIELQDSSASALLTAPGQPGFKYVVMPMRI